MSQNKASQTNNEQLISVVDNPATKAEPSANAEPNGRKPNKILIVIVLLLLLISGYYGTQWWQEGRFLVSTDDAYIGSDIALISPKVSGYVKNIHVTSNQQVKAGDPLITLDAGDYELNLAQANAQLDSQQLTLNRIDAQIAGARAGLLQAKAQKLALEATAKNAELSEQRATQLLAKSYGPQSSVDSASAAVNQSLANIAGADASIAVAQANISVLKAQRLEAEGALKLLQINQDKSQRDLEFTVLKAPYSGVVGNLSIQIGDLVSSGMRLAALIPSDHLYIDANFKETQIATIKPGASVSIHVDAHPDMSIQGSVVSIAPATGSIYSILPAENATGNFTKVVQRIPVRISIPASTLELGLLRAGYSVVVDVDTRTTESLAAVSQ